MAPAADAHTAGDYAGKNKARLTGACHLHSTLLPPIFLRPVENHDGAYWTSIWAMPLIPKGDSLKIELNEPVFGLPKPMPVAPSAQPVRRFQIKGGCAGIWEVIRDDRFHGHFTGYRQAMDAARAAATAILASGEAADIVFDPNGVMRTLEFRAGSAPIVR